MVDDGLEQVGGWHTDPSVRGRGGMASPAKAKRATPYASRRTDFSGGTGYRGKGMIPTRDHDRYGLGYYYMNMSNDLPGMFDVNAEQESRLSTISRSRVAAHNAGPAVYPLTPAGPRVTTWPLSTD